MSSRTLLKCSRLNHTILLKYPNEQNNRSVTAVTHSTDPQADSQQGLSYAAAGVNIDAGNELVERIKPACKSTTRPEVMGGIGGFGGLCRIPAGYQSPIMVSATDGVGTKLKLAIDQQRFEGIGIDLVAMCVNDLVVCGAEPLFFLDYYATGALDLDAATTVINSIADGCKKAGCALTGGETAEMPGMYQANDFDLAGFCVGIVEEEKIISGADVTAGDQLIALASSGPHSNGYSLIRKVLDHTGIDPTQEQLDGQPLIDLLLAPTHIYVKSLLALNKAVTVKSMAHITGGGLPENLPRVLPSTLQANINTQSWKWPTVFQWLQHQGNIDQAEMLRTFNCGVGMVVVVGANEADQALQQLADLGETAWLIGDISELQGNEQAQFL